MGSMSLIDRQNLAAKIIASGDLYRDDCACGLEYNHDSKSDLIELIETALEVIAPFGAAGLRDLAIYANELAEEKEFIAAYGQDEEELSEFDKMALKIAVNRIGGDQQVYNKATDLIYAGLYTVNSICRLSTDNLRTLLL
ncbi:hypothetical protein [Pseudomonas sp. XWY-1]|uniref:hypothetical protein n=1 Tax=Pseudomonas sp. XWY-1 TaxID=2069256 RepID=UPI000CF489B5|nr:hypothetical protein [Pseudomonas sp. XWY-1]